jgi:hypothetical protein
LLVAVVVGLVWVLIGVNRNGLISRIFRTRPGRFSLDVPFASDLSYYVLPIVAVIALHVLGLFREIIDPILQLFQ